MSSKDRSGCKLYLRARLYSYKTAIIIYNGQQYKIPLRYVYFKDELHDFEYGLDAGVFLFPKLSTDSNKGFNINEIGAAMYLSRRTIHSQLANLYLFDQESEYFKLVHTESNLFVNDLKQQIPGTGEFIYYQGLQGPIKIWEVNYPEDIKLNQEFLSLEYPEEIRFAKSGEHT